MVTHAWLKESRYPYAVVVVVVRDQDYQERLVRALHELEFEVRVADDAIRAIHLVQFEFELMPVILITEHDIDPELKVYDGIKLIEHLKGRKIFPIAPYYVAEEHSDALLGAAKAAGAEACFTKCLPGSPGEYNLGRYFKESILSAKKVLLLHHAKNLDRLTSKPDKGIYVYNMTGGEEYFEHIWREAQSTGMMPSVLSLDFVGFRGANAESHADGDRLVGEAAEVIVTHFKATDLIIRGHEKGDEFDVVLRNTSVGFAERAAKRVLEEFEKKEFYLSSGKPFRTKFRYGIATVGRTSIGLPARTVLSQMCKEANSAERKVKAQT